MENLKLLFDRNPVSIKNGSLQRVKQLRGRMFYVVEVKDNELSGISICKIIKYLNYYLEKYGRSKLPLLILFTNDVKLNDKLTYIMLESICYYFINNLGIEVHLGWNPKTDIITEGVNSSPLLLLNNASKANVQKFKNKFINDGFRNHFRRVVENSNENLCDVFQQVDSFFKLFDSCDSVKDDIVDVIAELVGNAFEHGGSDCLIDIDVADGYRAEIDGVVREAYSVNIVVVNFSQKLIGDELRDRLQDGDLTGERNKQLIEALEFHRNNLFDKQYTEEDFYNISVFQDRISGVDKGKTGGKGLTVLIKSLQQRSFENHCYMLSGNKTVFFNKEYLSYDENEWIGFNADKNFLKGRPDKSAIDECVTYMPGTAYNLDFIIMKGVNESNE